MGNRKESANLTRECITTALFMLSDEKSYDEITITDIAERAGVSRMAYYRNYKSKDDIVLSFLKERGGEIADLIKNSGKDLRGILMYVGEFFVENAALIKAIRYANLGNKAIGYMYDTIRELFPSSAENKVSEYSTTFHIGGVVWVFTQWLASGMKEDVNEIVDIILYNVNNDIEKDFVSTDNV